MVYVYYNLRLWVKRIERTPDVQAISLDMIDTTATWRVETERPILGSTPMWLEDDADVQDDVEVEDFEDQPDFSKETPL